MAVQCGLFWAVLFVTVRCGLFRAASFIAVQCGLFFGRCRLLQCDVGYFGWRHL